MRRGGRTENISNYKRRKSKLGQRTYLFDLDEDLWSLNLESLRAKDRLMRSNEREEEERRDLRDKEEKECLGTDLISYELK